MKAVTALWVLFGVGLVAMVLYAFGVIPFGTTTTGNGNGDAPAAVEESADNGENGEQAESDAAEDDMAADDSANGENGDSENVFTSAQADRGSQVYAQSCASCHGQDLDGEPPLSGSSFTGSWEGQTVEALYSVISQTMPQDSPGSLDPESYADVTAHILAFNGMPDGDDELDPEDSEQMQVAIRFGDGADDAAADADESSATDETADADGEDANGDAGDGDTADGDAANGDAADGEDAAADGGESADGVTFGDPGEAGQPGAGEGWIEIMVEPEAATVNVLGPGGYVGQFAGNGTLMGLEPGSYVLTAAQGNFSQRLDAEVVARQTLRLHFIIEELARSADLSGQAAGDDQAGQDQDAAADDSDDAATDNGEGSAANGDGDGANGNGESDADASDADENGNDANGNDANGNDANGNRESDEGNGNGDGWYTEEQAEAGADEFSASCASCHGEDGTGDPPLVDGALEQSFDNVWELFDYTSTEMPQDSPGSLDEDAYLAVVAYMLQLNDYPSGDEELEADEESMSEMELDGESGNGDGGDGNGNGNDDNGEAANGESGDANGADAEAGNGAESDGAADGAEDAGHEADDSAAADATPTERGGQHYASSCAMCHGPSLGGISAPPLAGPVFMDRWEGHPVEWLYFQARVSMPPDAPGSLDDQAYTDIIVYILAQNGILEGDEEFAPLDPLLRGTIIGTAEQQDQDLQQRIDSLRRAVHDPFDEDEDQNGDDPATTPDLPVDEEESPEPAEDTDAQEEPADDPAVQDPEAEPSLQDPAADPALQDPPVQEPLTDEPNLDDPAFEDAPALDEPAPGGGENGNEGNEEEGEENGEADAGHAEPDDAEDSEGEESDGEESGDEEDAEDGEEGSEEGEFE